MTEASPSHGAPLELATAVHMDSVHQRRGTGEFWRSVPRNIQQEMRKLALALAFAALALTEGCSTPQRSHASTPAAAAVTDLGTIALEDHKFHQCTLSGARICRVRLTALPNNQVLVEVAVLSQDAQGQPQRILARTRTETDPGKKVTLSIGDGILSLTPEIKPGTQL